MSRELNDEARALIRAARTDEQAPGGAHRARLRQKVLARAAAGSVVTLLGESVAQAGAHSLSSVVASSVGIGFGVGLVLAGAAPLAFSPSPAAHSVQAQAPTGSGRAAPRRRVVPESALADGERPAPPWTAPVASASSRELSEVNAAPAPRRPSLVAPPESALRSELDLMARVQEALRDNQGARALLLIASYDARHPSGVLASERLAAEVFAACQTGDRARARRAADRFLAQDGASSLAARVRNACAYLSP